LVEATGWKDADDGIFFITMDEFVANYVSLSTSHYVDEYELTNFKVTPETNMVGYFRFELTEATEVSI